MKTGAILLSLAVAAVQTVSFTNCCRGSFCDKKDDCPPCGEKSPEGRAPDDCCGTDAPSDPDRPGCVHLEPSAEVDSEVIPKLTFSPEASLLPDVEALPNPRSGWTTPETNIAWIPPPDTPAPLYLVQLCLRL